MTSTGLLIFLYLVLELCLIIASFMKDQEIQNDQAMFDAYVALRKIAQKYGLEEKLAIPRVVFVGETSSGKSM